MKALQTSLFVVACTGFGNSYAQGQASGSPAQTLTFPPQQIEQSLYAAPTYYGQSYTPQVSTPAAYSAYSYTPYSTYYYPYNYGYTSPQSAYSYTTPYQAPNYSPHYAMPSQQSNTNSYGSPGPGPKKRATTGQARPPFPKPKKEVKPWGDTRYIWPDFYTDFTGDFWDKMINAPYDLGYMPGGWRFPSLSSPDPVTVSDAIANQVPPFAEEAGNMVPLDDIPNALPF